VGAVSCMNSGSAAPSWCGEVYPVMKVSSIEPGRLFDALVTGILVIDRNRCLCAINGAAEALLSLSARKLLGQRAERILGGMPLLVAALDKAVRSGQPLTEREMQLPTAVGDTLTVDCMITPLGDGQHPGEVVIELVNVDRMHKIVREESLNAQHDMTSALIRGMAHEVKNPLGGIRGAAQLLERELDSEAHREYTRIIVGEVDRLRKLIDRMLLTDAVAHKVPLNIHEVLEHVRQLIQVEAGGITITRDYDPSLPELLADRDQLIQAFLNVTKNAVQAVHEGGSILLRTRAERQATLNGRRYRLAIRVDIVDNGPGVPTELASSIFYPMVTGRAEGTGLGLSITRSLVHHQGGTIEFNSLPGRTVFSIWLPVGSHDEGA